MALVSSTSIPSIPRSVLAASCRACCAASRHDCDETPTRSIVLMTATLRLLSVPVPADCRRPLSTVRVEPFREPERAPLVSQAPLVERHRQRAVHVGVEQTDDGAALA